MCSGPSTSSAGAMLGGRESNVTSEKWGGTHQVAIFKLINNLMHQNNWNPTLTASLAPPFISCVLLDRTTHVQKGVSTLIPVQLEEMLGSGKTSFPFAVYALKWTNRKLSAENECQDGIEGWFTSYTTASSQSRILSLTKERRQFLRLCTVALLTGHEPRSMGDSICHSRR